MDTTSSNLHGENAFDSLPRELLDCIVAHVSPDSSSLLALCTASRRLLEPCRTALFHDLTVAGSHAEYGLENLLQFIDGAPHIALLVRRLRLTNKPTRGKTIPDDRKWGVVETDLVLSIIDKFPNLVCIWLELMDIQQSVRNACHSPPRHLSNRVMTSGLLMEDLHFLTIFALWDILGIFTELGYLKIAYCKLYERPVQGASHLTGDELPLVLFRCRFTFLVSSPIGMGEYICGYLQARIRLPNTLELMETNFFSDGETKSLGNMILSHRCSIRSLLLNLTDFMMLQQDAAAMSISSDIWDSLNLQSCTSIETLSLDSLFNGRQPWITMNIWQAIIHIIDALSNSQSARTLRFISVQIFSEFGANPNPYHLVDWTQFFNLLSRFGTLEKVELQCHDKGESLGEFLKTQYPRVYDSRIVCL
ncbi:hypothetical protein C8Q75DRAFT_450820 [Abortiporus biennis]|nr:hypothetical protein C8Q75DRAFT_450820 [Abortiporus biennis]